MRCALCLLFSLPRRHIAISCGEVRPGHAASISECSVATKQRDAATCNTAAAVVQVCTPYFCSSLVITRLGHLFFFIFCKKKKTQSRSTTPTPTRPSPPPSRSAPAPDPPHDRSHDVSISPARSSSAAKRRLILLLMLRPGAGPAKNIRQFPSSLYKSAAPFTSPYTV